MSTLVSVVIIFLNAERFIEEAIESVRQQSFVHWELLLVDDGSQDGSTTVARDAALADPSRIRYLDHVGHENRGTSESRNLGLHEAHGDFILYLDADDILLPQALQRLIGIMERAPKAGVACGTTMFWFWAPEFAHKRDAWQSYGLWHEMLVAPPRFLSAILRHEILHPANCSTLIRSTLLRQVGGFDLAFRGMFEDTAVLAKLLLVAEIYVVDEILSAYRMHPTSLCHTAAAQGTYHTARPNADREHYLRWLQGVVARSDVRDLRLSMTLALELAAYRNPRLHRALHSRLATSMGGGVRRLLRPAAAATHGATIEGPPPTVAALQMLEQFYQNNTRVQDAESLSRRWRSLTKGSAAC